MRTGCGCLRRPVLSSGPRRRRDVDAAAAGRPPARRRLGGGVSVPARALRHWHRACKRDGCPENQDQRGTGVILCHAPQSGAVVACGQRL